MSTPSLRPVGITGLGYYVPSRIVTNDDLAKFVDTDDEWIRSRTGIQARRFIADDESTADMAEHASRAALTDAGIDPSEVQLIIVATCTADFQFPSTASILQNRLGANCGGLDLGAACSGFVYALVVASQFVASGAYDRVLVVASEAMSRILDWNDRTTCVLFGDGAGAAVVQAVPEGSGIQGFDLGADGSGGPLLKVSNRLMPGEKETSPYIVQNGREVYRFAVNIMGESAVRALENAGIPEEEIDLLVPHQANTRIIDAAAKRLKLPSEKVFINIEKYGNTSAASIPIALCEARAAGKVKHGDTIVAVGFGGGVTWASCVMKWFDRNSQSE